MMKFTHQLHVLHINIKVEFLFCLTIMESKLSPKKKKTIIELISNKVLNPMMLNNYTCKYQTNKQKKLFLCG